MRKLRIAQMVADAGKHIHMEKPYTPDYELALFKLILQCCGVTV